MIKKSLMFFMLSGLSSCSSLNEEVGLKDDNLLEETVEAVIEEKTGIEVDLTPSTPEKDTPLNEIIHLLEDKMRNKEPLPDNDKHTRGHLKVLFPRTQFRT